MWANKESKADDFVAVIVLSFLHWSYLLEARDLDQWPNSLFKAWSLVFIRAEEEGEEEEEEAADIN